MIPMKMCILLGLLLLQSSLAFPRNFIFGTSTSAYQTEGAWLEEGKGFTEWDNFDHTLGYVRDNSTADTTCDSYHKFDQDIALLRQYGIKHYRMSIQWSRIMPYARPGTPINMEAVEHYRKMLTMLRDAGIEPYANICHNDLPAALYLFGNGPMDEDFPDDYVNYAEQCFKLFGDLVRRWFTFDEPWCHATDGPFEEGERNTKPYIIAHNLLLAHSRAVKLYREKYQPAQHGFIGINLNGAMYWPKDPESEADREAAVRNIMFVTGWFWNPIMTGDYPQVMKDRVGTRLPQFTEEQKATLKGSADFFALNHYYSFVTEDGGHTTLETYEDDLNTTATYKPEWKVSDVGFSIVPEGFHDLLLFIHNTWLKGTDIPLYVTENGVSVPEPEIASAVSDPERIDFYYSYMRQMELAIAEGVNVAGYFSWSLLDNFEWGQGLKIHFGLTRVDYDHDFKRIPKSSLSWISELIHSRPQPRT